MLEAGNCITMLDKYQRPHLFIVLNEPTGNPMSVCVVNLTTYKSDEESDTAVVLESGHSFIKHKTVVNYARARVVNAAGLEAKVYDQNDQTSFHRERKCTPEFLKIVRDGVKKSRQTRDHIKDYCKDKF